MRLTKTTKTYLLILYVVWKLLTYYEKFFELCVPSDATKLPVKLFIDDDNITHLVIEIQSFRTPDPYYTGESMKDIFNEYLSIVLLPEQPELKAFAGGSSIYDVVDCLYVKNAYVLDNGYAYIDIIYVDNMQAFRLVKKETGIKEERYPWMI